MFFKSEDVESPESAAAAVDAVVRQAVASGEKEQLLAALAMDDGVRARAAGRARGKLPAVLACGIGLAVDAVWAVWFAVHSNLVAVSICAAAAVVVVAIDAKPLAEWAAWRKVSRRRSACVDDARRMLLADSLDIGPEAAARFRMSAFSDGNVQAAGRGNVVNGDMVRGTERPLEDFGISLARAGDGPVQRAMDFFAGFFVNAPAEALVVVLCIVGAAFLFATAAMGGSL